MKFGFWFNFIVFLKIKTKNKAVCYVFTRVISYKLLGKLQEVQKKLSASTLHLLLLDERPD